MLASCPPDYNFRIVAVAVAVATMRPSCDNSPDKKQISFPRFTIRPIPQSFPTLAADKNWTFKCRVGGKLER